MIDGLAFSCYDMLQKTKQFFQGICFLSFDKMFSSENKSKFIESTALSRDRVNDHILQANACAMKEFHFKTTMISKKIIILMWKNRCPFNKVM